MYGTHLWNYKITLQNLIFYKKHGLVFHVNAICIVKVTATHYIQVKYNFILTVIF